MTIDDEKEFSHLIHMPNLLYEHVRRKMKTHLEQWVASDHAQEPLETFSSSLDDFVREAVGEHLARKRRDVDASGFTLEDVPEGFKVGISSANQGMT